MSRSYNLGFFTGKYNHETINRLLNYLEVSCKPVMIRDLEDMTTRMMDAIFVINPIFDRYQKQAFLDFIESGGNSLFLISFDLDSYKECLPLLNEIGVDLKGKRRTKKLAVQYLDSYPKAHRRGTKKIVGTDKPTSFARLGIFDSAAGKNVTPMIKIRELFATSYFAVEAKFGQGSIIVMSSSCLPEDRAEILSYLLMNSGEVRSNYHQEVLAKIRTELPYLIEDSFEVYQEVPVEIIYRKLNIRQTEIDMIELLMIIEDIIRDGEIVAKIRGNVLVRH